LRTLDDLVTPDSTPATEHLANIDSGCIVFLHGAPGVGKTAIASMLTYSTLEWGPKCRFIWRVEQLLIIYEDTVAICFASVPQTYQTPLSPFGLAPFTKPLRVRNADFAAERRQV